MLVEFIVVTYHSSAQTGQELDRLMEGIGRHPAVGLAIVDNSEDSSDAKWLEGSGKLPALARVIKRPDNPGFAGGCNAAALSSPAAWIVFLNPDVLLNPDSVERIVDAVQASHGETAAIAISQMTNSMCHEGVTLTAAGWFLDRVVGGYASRARVSRALSGPNILLGPSGGAGAYRRATFVRHGGFYERLFAWGEDADLALRLHLFGETVVGLGLDLKHQGGHSITSVELARFRAKLLARNRVVIAARLYTLPQAIIFGVFFFLVLLAKLPAMMAARTLSANLSGVAEGTRLWVAARRDYQGPRYGLRNSCKWAG